MVNQTIDRMDKILKGSGKDTMTDKVILKTLLLKNYSEKETLPSNKRILMRSTSKEGHRKKQYLQYLIRDMGYFNYVMNLYVSQCVSSSLNKAVEDLYLSGNLSLEELFKYRVSVRKRGDESVKFLIRLIQKGYIKTLDDLISMHKNKNATLKYLTDIRESKILTSVYSEQLDKFYEAVENFKGTIDAEIKYEAVNKSKKFYEEHKKEISYYIEKYSNALIDESEIVLDESKIVTDEVVENFDDDQEDETSGLKVETEYLETENTPIDTNDTPELSLQVILDSVFESLKDYFFNLNMDNADSDSSLPEELQVYHQDILELYSIVKNNKMRHTGREFIYLNNFIKLHGNKTKQSVMEQLYGLNETLYDYLKDFTVQLGYPNYYDENKVINSILGNGKSKTVSISDVSSFLGVESNKVGIIVLNNYDLSQEQDRKEYSELISRPSISQKFALKVFLDYLNGSSEESILVSLSFKYKLTMPELGVVLNRGAVAHFVKD